MARTPSPRRDRHRRSPSVDKEKDRRREKNRRRGSRERREKSEDRKRRRNRSESRSRARRSRSRGRSRSRSGSRSRGASKAKKDFFEKPVVTEADLEGKTPDEQEMMKAMGFCAFDSTKGKPVPGNNVGAVHVILKRKYRQYMNRKGGFNRPLDFVA